MLALAAAIAAADPAAAAGKQIRVFIALCDNESQGVAPVPERIGDGDDPDANLYWGCSDGFGSFFRRSAQWKKLESQKDVSSDILRRMVLRHEKADLSLTADAYRGSSIKQCIADFEAAAASGEYDLVAFIGHNGLMDFDLPLPARKSSGRRTDAVVLCCLSESYFQDRLQRLSCRPILLTRQLMYPGAFLLHDAIEQWSKGGTLHQIRAAAGRAYARNQKIRVSAATGVFSELKESAAGEAPASAD